MGNRWIWGGVLLLAILHQDSWLWNDGRVVLGFLPAGLAYHAAFSLVAAAFWWSVVREAASDENGP